MSPVRHPRSVVPHPSLRIRWGWLSLAGFAILCAGSALGAATFPLIVALALAWALWRGDRDGGRH